MQPDWPTAWNASWIWHGRPLADHDERFCFLRRRFEVTALPGAAKWARVTADSRYVLWCNGVEVARGPARAVPDRISFASIDLGPYLRPGDNAVAALVRFYGRPQPWWRPAPPSGALGHGSFAFEAPGLAVASDETWRAHATPYTPSGDDPRHGLPPEFLDGREWPVGWTGANFDDSAWEPATVLRAPGPSQVRAGVAVVPFTAPEPDAIAMLTSDVIDLEQRDGSRVYDAGHITLATPRVTLTGPRGAEVRIVTGEDLRADGSVETAPRDYELRYTLAGDGDRGESVEGFEAVGFRYLAVESSGGVAVKSVVAVERRYPRTGGAFFECDDERLNRIWQLGARTLDVCSTDAFLDCPGREQRAWLGDAYIHSLLTYVTNTDWRLVRRHIRVCAQGARDDGLLPMAAVGDLSLLSTTIPDYSLHWIRTLAAYVRHTRDVELGQELHGVVEGIVAAFERYRSDDDGLLHRVPGWVFIDWASTERSDVVGALDALYAIALEDAAALGVGGAAELAGRSRAALDTLWDDERGVYVDAITPDGPGRRVSQQTNAVAVLARPNDHERNARILDAILDRERVVVTPTTADMPSGQELRSQYGDPVETCAGFDPEVSIVAAQPFFRHFVHQAVVAAGRRELIVDLCLDWWPQVERGNTTFEEYWNAAPGRASRAHAWAGTPTYDLTTHVLGVHVNGPGDVEHDPCLGPLQWARGAVPTVDGLVEIEVGAP